MPNPPIEHSYVCIGCGYSLTGITATRCPECGRAILAADVIARYRGSTPGVKVTFALCPDRVVVHQKWFLRGDSLSSVRLNKLESDPSFIRLRPAGFNSGLAVTVLGATFLILYIANPRDMGWFVLVTGVIATVCGLMLAALNFRRVEWVRFINQFGIIQLNIPRRGPDAALLDDFVLNISEHIARARTTAG